MKVIFITKQLAILLFISLLSVACGNQKTGSMENVVPTKRLEGYQVHDLSPALLKQSSAEHPIKIEIIPGKSMEVDCNHHSLVGEFSEKVLSDGNSYYLFESDGEAISTLMACPDNTKRKEFVRGQSIFVDLNEALPSVVLTSDGIEIKHRIWNATSLYTIEKGVDNSVETEATKALKAYPESLEGYDRYLLILPEIKNSMIERKVEIIPGVTTEVDCNKHALMGKFVEKEIEGWGYNYLIFDSDGGVRSTRMACPENSRHTERVTGATHLMNYNSRLPIVIFIPKKDEFSVQYRVWEAGDLK